MKNIGKAVGEIMSVVAFGITLAFGLRLGNYAIDSFKDLFQDRD